MKKILFAITLLICANVASAQFYQIVKGHYEFQFFKVDSVFSPPQYHTTGRPAASVVQIIYNIDSAKLQYSDGANWHTIDGTTGGGGGGGGSVINVGAGFRLIVAGTNIKTLGQNFGLILDSLTANEIHYTVDSSKIGTLYQVNLRVKYTDTAAMLSAYLRKADTIAMLAPYLRKIDTTAMLVPYLRKVDTASMLAAYLRKQDTAAMLNSYLRKTDTTAMLLAYLRKTDTAAMLLPYLRKTDTAAMLSPYFRKVDTSLLNLTARFALKLNISDTAAMLLPYLRKADTAAMLSPYARNNLVVKYTDTSSMLSPYLRKFDTTAMLAPYLRSNIAASLYYPLSSNPSNYISRTGISAGPYLTYNSSTGVMASDTGAGKLATKTDLTLIPLPSTQIAVGNASNLFSSSNTFTWDNPNSKLRLNGITLGYATGQQGGLIIAPGGDFPASIPAGTAIIGWNSAWTTLNGANNTGFGSTVFSTISSGNNNTGIGSQSLQNVTTSSFNTAVGSRSLSGLTSGSNDNINIGASKGTNGFITTSRSILIGNDSIASNKSLNNGIYIGHAFALANYRNNLAYFGQNNQVINLGNGGMTTAQYSALGTTATVGDQYYNIDSLAYIMYNGTSWIRWGGTSAGGVAGITSINTLVNSSITLATGTLGTDFNISTTAPGTINFNLPTVSAGNRGLVTPALFSTWNAKQNALSIGNLTEATSSVLTLAGNIGAVIGSGTTIQVKQANNIQSGYLSSTDWNTFNAKGNGIVTSISSGSPAIGIGGTASVPIITFNLSGLPNSYYVNGLHVRNDSTAVLGGNLDSAIVFDGHGDANSKMTWDSTQLFLTGAPWNSPIGLDTVNYKPIVRNISTGLLATSNWNSPLVTSGTYTPLLTNTTNIGFSSLSTVSYFRIGNIVYVEIGLSIQPTATGTASVLTISLPINTATTSQLDVGKGVIYNMTGNGFYSGIISVNSASTVTFSLYPMNTQIAQTNISFTYKL